MKIISKLSAAAVAAVIALTGVQAEAQTSRLPQILEAGKIRVGTTGDFNPMTVRDITTGSFKGFEIDAANKLAADMGVEVEFVTTDWRNMVAGVLAGNYDIVMSGTSIDMNRAKVVGYTNPYIHVGTVPMTLRRNAERFQTWEDANQAGVRVAVILGTVFEQQARAVFPNATVVTVEAPATGFQEVLSGRADVTITSNIDAASIMERFEAMTVLGDAELQYRRPLGYIVPQGDHVLINYLNAWLAMNQANGFFDELARKWGL